jgi:uncharacterized membrane protein YobD (UPF0266 family)
MHGLETWFTKIATSVLRILQKYHTFVALTMMMRQRRGYFYGKILVREGLSLGYTRFDYMFLP